MEVLKAGTRRLPRYAGERCIDLKIQAFAKAPHSKVRLPNGSRPTVAFASRVHMRVSLSAKPVLDSRGSKYPYFLLSSPMSFQDLTASQGLDLLSDGL